MIESAVESDVLASVADDILHDSSNFGEGCCTNVREQKDRTNLPSMDAELAGSTEDDQRQAQEHQRKRCKRRRLTKAATGHSTGSGLHTKKTERRRAGARQRDRSLITDWKEVFVGSSPNFNSIERALLRKMSVMVVDDEDEEPPSFGDLNLKNYPYATLERAWNVVAAAATKKDPEFRSFIRAKTATSLKDEIRRMSSSDLLSVKIKAGKPQRSIIRTLLQAADSIDMDAPLDEPTCSDNALGDHDKMEVRKRRRPVHLQITSSDDEHEAGREVVAEQG